MIEIIINKIIFDDANVFFDHFKACFVIIFVLDRKI